MASTGARVEVCRTVEKLQGWGDEHGGKQTARNHMEFQFGEQLQKKKQFNKMSKSRDFKLIVTNLSEHVACKKTQRISRKWPDRSNSGFIFAWNTLLEHPSLHQAPMLKGIIELPAEAHRWGWLKGRKLVTVAFKRIVEILSFLLQTSSYRYEVHCRDCLLV